MFKGKAKEDDLGFVETQEGLVDGQGIIFLQHQGEQNWGNPKMQLATLSMENLKKTNANLGQSETTNKRVTELNNSS